MPTPSSRARLFCGRRGICFCWFRPSRCRSEVVVILSEGPAAVGFRPDSSGRPARSRRISLRLTAFPALHLKGCSNFQLLTFTFPSYPLHSTTGNLGYFGNDGSLADFSHKMNTEPRSDSTRRACTQSAHNPARLRCTSGFFSSATLGRLPSAVVVLDRPNHGRCHPERGRFVADKGPAVCPVSSFGNHSRAKSSHIGCARSINATLLSRRQPLPEMSQLTENKQSHPVLAIIYLANQRC
jgi:hypothetical protein